MLESINKSADRKSAQRIFCAFMVLSASVCMTSCGSDEPEEGGKEDLPQTGLVSAADLEGEWTLARDVVLYSQTDSQKEDKTINYSGNSSPYYKYYRVTVSENEILSMVEVSLSGTAIGTKTEYTLKGNDLINVADNSVAGTIAHYDTNHAWDNLRIHWNKDNSPTDFKAPVISTYMN